MEDACTSSSQEEATRTLCERLGQASTTGLDMDHVLDLCKQARISWLQQESRELLRGSLKDFLRVMLQYGIQHEVMDIVSLVVCSLPFSSARSWRQQWREDGALEDIAQLLSRSVPHQSFYQPLLDTMLSIAELSHATALLLTNRFTQCFTVRVSPSSVRQGGDGLWVQGTAAPGSVVAVYPGEQRHGISLMDLEDTTYCVALLNGRSLNDASPAALQRVCAALLREGTSQAAWGADNAQGFFCGHKVNHPPAGVKPSVLLHEMRCFDKQPCCLSVSEKDGSYAVPETVLILIAIRTLSNEEVFVDYGWENTHATLPAWYHGVIYE